MTVLAGVASGSQSGGPQLHLSAARACGLAGEGQKGMRKVGIA